MVAPLQYHAWVEFGNRLVNVAITLAIVLVALSALARRPRRRDLLWLSFGLVVGILGEVVLGGETVLYKLAAPLVMAHMLLAVLLLATAVVLYQRAGEPDDTTGLPKGRARAAPLTWRVSLAQRTAAQAMLGLTAVVVALGTVVTGTGPHAGAPGVPRFGFSLHAVAQLHGTSVEVLLALTVATLWWLHRTRAPFAVMRRGEVLLVVMVAQAAIGYTQYFSGDPALLVGFHLAGASSLVVAMVAFNLGLYARRPRPPVPTVSVEGTSARALVEA